MHSIRYINLKLEFISPGIRFRIIKIFFRLFRLKDFDFFVNFYGRKYKGNTQNHIDFMVFFFGAYEKGILNFLARLLKPESVIFDIGANIGHHALFFSTISKNVYAFEPYSPVRSQLERKILLNSSSEILVVPVGLSDKEQTLEYFEPPASNMGAGSFVKEHSTGNSRNGLKLQLVKGDHFVLSEKINRLDLIKIDVEGFEYNVLAGLKNTLAKFRPIIVLELNLETINRFGTEDEFINFFPPHYSFHRLENQFADMATLAPFKLKKVGTTNLICIPKAV